MRLRSVATTAVAATVALVSLATLTADHAAVCPVGVSHRGSVATGGPPENSIAAYIAAWDTGITWAEGDVRFTADDVAVIMHDDTVNRTTDGTGKVHEMTAAEFTSLNLADGQHPPTLAQVIAMTRPDRRMVLELKRWLTPAQEKVLLAQLRGHEDRVSISGFSYVVGNLERLKAADPALDVSFITTTPVPPPAWSDGQHLQLTPALTAAEVETLHRAGVEVMLWLPDNITEWDRARDLGADAVTTNRARAYMQWVSGGCA